VGIIVSTSCAIPSSTHGRVTRVVCARAAHRNDSTRTPRHMVLFFIDIIKIILRQKIRCRAILQYYSVIDYIYIYIYKKYINIFQLLRAICVRLTIVCGRLQFSAAALYAVR